jgi:hypothetical protein
MSDEARLLKIMAKCIKDGLGYRNSDVIAKYALNAIQDSGYTIVPVEPTGDMNSAGHHEILLATSDEGHCGCDPDYIYRAMIKAAETSND